MQKHVLVPWKYYGKKVDISKYTHIRAYHACRIEDKCLYQTKGLVPIDRDGALKKALRILMPFVKSKARIEKVFEKIWEEVDNHRVWFAFKKNELLRESSHYLIYGSEVLSAVANNLGYRNELRSIGIPYILTCEIRLSRILCDMTDSILYNMGGGFPVDNLPPDEIIKFEKQKSMVEDPYTKEFVALNCCNRKIGFHIV